MKMFHKALYVVMNNADRCRNQTWFFFYVSAPTILRAVPSLICMVGGH